MTKHYGILTAAALAVGGMGFIGCHNGNPDTAPAASVGGMSGGGSTDSYGTGPGARYRSTGNIGMDTGGAAGNSGVSPQPAAVGERANDNQPPQTPVGPGGTSTTGNGSNQGSTTGRESGPGVRTSETDRTNSGAPNNRAPNNGTPNNNGNSGAVIGGTAGNGTTNSGVNVGGPGTPSR